MICLRPIRSDNLPNTMKNGVPSTSAIASSMFAGAALDLQRLVQEKQRVELARVPDHRLARACARTARCNTSFRLRHSPKLSRSGALDCGRSAFICANSGDSSSFKRMYTEIASRSTETRNGMRQPQALNASSPIADAATEDHRQRQEQPQRRSGLDPSSCSSRADRAAHARRRRLPRHRIHRRAPGPVARRNSDQQHRRRRCRPARRPAARRPVRSTSHDDDRHQEGVLAADQITQTAEHERTERAYGEAGGERREAREERRCIVAGWEEQTAEERLRACRTDRSRTTRRPCRATMRRSRVGGGGRSLSRIRRAQRSPSSRTVARLHRASPLNTPVSTAAGGSPWCGSSYRPAVDTTTSLREGITQIR